MDPDTVRLNVTLSKDLVADLSRHVGARKKSQFIAMAIRRQIEADRKMALERELEEGYRTRAQESLAVSQDFASVDLEGWDAY